MKDLGATKKILGKEIMRDRVVGRLSLSQKGYIEKVLRDSRAVGYPESTKFMHISSYCRSMATAV